MSFYSTLLPESSNGNNLQMIKPIASFKLSCTDIEHSNLSSPSTDDSPNTPTFSGNRPEMYDCVQYTSNVENI